MTNLNKCFSGISLKQCWKHLCMGNFAKLANKAILILLVFPTSYLREKRFFTMSKLKTLKINRLQIERDYIL